jgi:FtsZ-binding cell division protein ZapB
MTRVQDMINEVLIPAIEAIPNMKKEMFKITRQSEQFENDMERAQREITLLTRVVTDLKKGQTQWQTFKANFEADDRARRNEIETMKNDMN